MMMILLWPKLALFLGYQATIIWALTVPKSSYNRFKPLLCLIYYHGINTQILIANQWCYKRELELQEYMEAEITEN